MNARERILSFIDILEEDVRETAEAGADIASSIWESLLRDALGHLEFHDESPCGWHTQERSDLIDRIREALG